MKIYLIRHGQTTGDIEDRFGGDYEDHLTTEGETQAHQLAEKLSGSNIQKIYVSPRVRAQETGAILNRKLGTPLETLENIRERNHYGVMTGMIKSEAREKYPHYIELLKDTKNTVEGGEDYASFKTRVEEAFKNVSEQNMDLPAIGMLSHGGVIRVVFREILKMGEIDINDCAYAVIDVDGDEVKVIFMDGIRVRE